MSRSGYCDDIDDPLAFGRWRAAVNSAFRGKRGQRLLRDALDALDAMPDKRLVAKRLVVDGWQPPWGGDNVVVGGDDLADDRGLPLPMGSVCLLGAVAQQRKLSVSDVDPDDYATVAARFDIAEAMSREIVYMNDEGSSRYMETPEQRWQRMRAWVASRLLDESDKYIMLDGE